MQYLPSKAAAGVVDYGLDWGPFLSIKGDLTIASSAWVNQTGDAITSLSSHTDKRTAVRISGGSPETETIFRNLVTLSNAEVYWEDVYLRILP